MLDVLKNISFIGEIRADSDGRGWLMSVDGHRARGELFHYSFTISIFIRGFDSVSWTSLCYLTLLLAAHPDIHDYAIQVTLEGGWLYGYYDKNTPSERMAIEIEKHIALASYLQNIIGNRKETHLSGLSDESK